MEDVIRFVNVFSAALAAGGTAVVLAIFLPALRQLPERDSVRLHQIVTPLFYRYQPVATVISAVGAVAVLVIDPNLTSIQGLATLGGLACTAGVALVSFRFNQPMNSVIARWSPDAVPPEYARIRARWNTAHAARTALAVAAFGLYLVAAMVA